MIPVAEMFFHEPMERIIGVLPFIPQVLLTVGRSEKPDSSRKQRIALSEAPFLEWPAISQVSILLSLFHLFLGFFSRVFGKRSLRHREDARRNEAGILSDNPCK